MKGQCFDNEAEECLGDFFSGIHRLQNKKGR